MKAREFAKGSSRAIGITLTPDSPEALLQEFRLVKADLLDWKRKWGAGCDMVVFTVIMDPVHHALIEETIEKMYRHEIDLAPLLQRLRVHVNLLNAQARPVKEYTIERHSQAVTVRPWWKFW
ncbi:MAG: hypothetical protein V1918_04335 [Planctomycetota bacterium]